MVWPARKASRFSICLVGWEALGPHLKVLLVLCSGAASDGEEPCLAMYKASTLILVLLSQSSASVGLLILPFGEHPNPAVTLGLGVSPEPAFSRVNIWFAWNFITQGCRGQAQHCKDSFYYSQILLIFNTLCPFPQVKGKGMMSTIKSRLNFYPCLLSSCQLPLCVRKTMHVLLRNASPNLGWPLKWLRYSFSHKTYKNKHFSVGFCCPRLL